MSIYRFRYKVSFCSGLYSFFTMFMSNIGYYFVAIMILTDEHLQKHYRILCVNLFCSCYYCIMYQLSHCTSFLIYDFIYPLACLHLGLPYFSRFPIPSSSIKFHLKPFILSQIKFRDALLNSII